MAAEPSLGVDDLAGDPGRLVGDQPGDESRWIIRNTVSTVREHGCDRSQHLLREIAGVDGAGVDGVDTDSVIGELVGDGCSDSRECSFCGRVCDFAGHGAKPLPGRQKHNRSPRIRCMLPCKCLSQQDRSAGVHRPMLVQLHCGELVEYAVRPGKRLVADQRVHSAELLHSRRKQLLGRFLLGEVAVQVSHTRIIDQVRTNPVQHGFKVISTPGLLLIMRRVVVTEHTRAVGGEPARCRMTDPGPATDTGHQDRSTMEW